METKVSSVTENNAKAYKEAAKILKNGGLVAFPTETVYGLGGNALDEEAAKHIYAAKGRPSDNPLIIHIAEKEALKVLAKNIPDAAWKLAEVFWPGPLTMVLSKQNIVPYGTTGGLETVAIRMPNHPVALRLIKESGVYIAAPSANTSGRPSPTLAEHVYEDLHGRIDMILDGGMVQVGIESTILDLTEEVPVILRPGCITQEMLMQEIGEVRMDPAIAEGKGKEQLRPKAPGMKYKHYAPKAELTIFTGEKEKVTACINERIAMEKKNGKTIGVIATDETLQDYPEGVVCSIGSRTEEGSVARGLYKILRDFDHMQVDAIYAESFETDRLGTAIMNRLLKAAGYAVEYV